LDAIIRLPRLLVVSVQAMHSDEAEVELAVECATDEWEIGLVFQWTNCKPWATAAAGAADTEDTRASLGTYLAVRACETGGAFGDVPLPCSSPSRNQGAVASRCFRVKVGGES
jgi:hypothetical protein